MIPLAILVVDDEKVQRDALAEILKEQAFVVTVADGLASATELLKQQAFDAILTDFRMPGGSGLDVARAVLEFCPSGFTIIITAFAEVQSVIEAMRLGVLDYMLKPLHVPTLLLRLKLLSERKELREEVHALRTASQRSKQSGRLLGGSQVMAEVRNLIEQLSQTMGTVLITGESGTGKEVAAREIHARSKQRDKNFVAINCAAIPEQLLESELFGHKKGSFTGATADKVGLFAAANGGTLFLDEIAEMPKALQVKLLRALQERVIAPIGATTPQKVDVRLVTATNRDLQAEVASGNFRSDLFYRINVVEIHMPPLRDHKDDIPVLAEHFVNKYSKELRRGAPRVSSGALACLREYAWPGNVRELENVIERAMILNRGGGTIEPTDLPVAMQSTVPAGEGNKNSHSLEQAIKEFSKHHIVKTIEAFAYDKKAAAKALGISLSSLYRKLEELGMSGPTE